MFLISILLYTRHKILHKQSTLIFYHFKYWIKFLFKSKNKLKSLKVLFLNIYFLVRHLGEKSILWVFSLTCWGLTGSQHISTTLTILHYLDLKVAAWVTCFRCTYFEIMLEGATVHMQLLQQHYRVNPEGGKARHGSDYTRLKFDVSNIGAADQLLELQGHPLGSLVYIKEKIISKHDLIK